MSNTIFPAMGSVHTVPLLPLAPSHQTCGLLTVPEQEQSQRQHVPFSTDTYGPRDTGLVRKVVFAPCPDHDTKESQDFPTSPPAKGLPAAHVGSPRPVEAEQLQVH